MQSQSKLAIMFIKVAEKHTFTSGTSKLLHHLKVLSRVAQDRQVHLLILQRTVFCACTVTAREKQAKQVCYVESRFREIDKKILQGISNRSYDERALLVYGRIQPEE